jgi:hypothetical protein
MQIDDDHETSGSGKWQPAPPNEKAGEPHVGSQDSGSREHEATRRCAIDPPASFSLDRPRWLRIEEGLAIDAMRPTSESIINNPAMRVSA